MCIRDSHKLGQPTASRGSGAITSRTTLKQLGEFWLAEIESRERLVGVSRLDVTPQVDEELAVELVFRRLDGPHSSGHANQQRARGSICLLYTSPSPRD